MSKKEAFRYLYESGYGSQKWRAGYEYNQRKTEAPTPPAQPVEHIDPETGEIIEAPDYPAAWDEIAPPAPGTAEYSEMLRYELDAYEPNSPEYIAVLSELDPKAAAVLQTFGV